MEGTRAGKGKQALESGVGRLQRQRALQLQDQRQEALQRQARRQEALQRQDRRQEELQRQAQRQRAFRGRSRSGWM